MVWITDLIPLILNPAIGMLGAETFSALLFRAAWIDKCRPNLMISESTYATTIRDSKRCRERDFLKKVHESIERGGKVGDPRDFALGSSNDRTV